MSYTSQIKTIDNISDFKKLISKVRGDSFWDNYFEFFRGQPSEKFKLIPTIARKTVNNNLEYRTVEEIKSLEQKILSFIDTMLKGDLKKNFQLSISENIFEDQWRTIEQLQHYGIPTRLLDWSTNAQVSLFFSCNSYPDENGQFWVFKTPRNWETDGHFEKSPYFIKGTQICSSSFHIEEDYDVKSAEKNRTAQQGKFTIQDYDLCNKPMEEQIDFQNLLEKYIIPKESKKLFLDYLKQEFNICQDTIYNPRDKTLDDFFYFLKSELEL